MDDKGLIKRAESELRDAYDYDTRDALFDLTKDDMCATRSAAARPCACWRRAVR